MKKLTLILALAVSAVAAGQTPTPQYLPSNGCTTSSGGNLGCNSVVANTSITSPLVNKILGGGLSTASDLGAQLSSMVSSASCTSGCSIVIPPGAYVMATSAAVTAPNVHISGYGVTISIASNYGIGLNGSGDAIEGITFLLTGQAGGYGTLAGVQVSNSAANVLVRNNVFTGATNQAIRAYYPGPGLAIEGNTFNSDSNGYGPNGIQVAFGSFCRVSGNHFNNSYGFGVQFLGSHNCVASQNDFVQPQFVTSATAIGSQTSYTVTFPNRVTRISVQDNGTPVTVSSTTNISGNQWTVVLNAAGTPGDTLTFIGWQAYENLQANWNSYGINLVGNTMDGTGDSGIVLGSDYTTNILGSSTPSSATSVFNFSGTVTFYPALTVNGRALTGTEISSISANGSSYTFTLSNPVPAGTTVSFVDVFLSGSPSQSDMPSSINITGNTIRRARASCVATTNLSIYNLSISGNTFEDCGQGMSNATGSATFQSGIYLAGSVSSPIHDTITGNTFTSTLTVPTMLYGVFFYHSADDGSPQKSIVLRGNAFNSVGTPYTIPIPSNGERLAGIDVDGQAVPYPEQPNFDTSWSGLPSNTNYWSYSKNNAAVSRDTTDVLGGAASIAISSTGESGSSQFQMNVLDTQVLGTGIMQVSFWAKAASGTMTFSVYSFNLGGSYSRAESTISISSTTWQKYSLYLSTQGLDLSQQLQLRFSAPGSTSSTIYLSGFQLLVVPLSSGGYSGNGAAQSASTLPNGSTAATQTAGDNSTKVATTAYVAAPGAISPTSLAVNGGTAMTGSQGTGGYTQETTNGTKTSGNFVSFDANKNTVDSSLAVTAVPQKVISCGATSGSVTCGNSAVSSPRILTGLATLSSGTAVISGISPAWTSTTSFACTGTDNTATNVVKIANTSVSSITFTGTSSDVIGYVCVGN